MRDTRGDADIGVPVCPVSSTGTAWTVGVVIPACDEAATIVSCVRSVCRALDELGNPLRSWVAVVADACTDDTAQRAQTALGPRGEVIESSARAAGAARQIGAQAILRRFTCIPRDALWIANTDADSSVPTDWIREQLRLAAQGYCGVAGIVGVDFVGGLPHSSLRRIMHDYVVHPDGSHPHVHGANMGVRADAYLDAGGWKELRLAEDHCLWNRIRARNWQTISSSSSRVTTSGRLKGRAPGGFAADMGRRLWAHCRFGGAGEQPITPA